MLGGHMKKLKLLPNWAKISILLLFLIVVGIIIYFTCFNKSKEEKQIEKQKQASEITTKEECLKEGFYWWSKNNTCNAEKAKLTIVNEKSKTRPIAVMINNHAQARPYHSGLQDANIVYEIIVEGGITRMMAVFKDAETARIGSVRSSRHYFLDYALENDAIYVHFGWSPQAESDISTLGVNNINGLYYDSGRSRTDSASFWRTNQKAAPHNAMGNMENLMKVADKLKYRRTSTATSVLNYVPDEVELDGDMEALKVTIPYSTSNTVKYDYD